MTTHAAEPLEERSRLQSFEEKIIAAKVHAHLDG
jgi:hypothetical protein